MALTIKKDDTYSWPCSVDIPVDGGKYIKQTFTCKFKRAKQTENEKFQMMLKNEELKNARLIAEKVLVGWEGIQDEDGNEILFTDVTSKQILDAPMIAIAIASSYFESLGGARRKN